MAGIRHHYVPRWLQAGFADAGAGAKSRTWLYRSTWQEPKFVATKDVGLEEHFYSYKTEGERRSADERMTAAEGNLYGPMVRRLKAGTVGLAEEPHTLLCEFFAHTEVRTKSFRDYLMSACAPLANAITEYVANPELFRPYLTKLVAAQPQVFIDVLAKVGLTVSTNDLIASLSSAHEVPYNSAEQSTIARFKAIPWEAILVANMKAGHIEALFESLASEERKRLYTGRDFYIKDFPDAVFVQGDSVLVFRQKDGRYSSLAVQDADIDFAWLPLSPTRILFAGTPEQPLPSWQELRHASITCSRDYFIARDYSLELRHLAPSIGKAAPSISEVATQAWMQEALIEPLSPGWDQRTFAQAEHLDLIFAWLRNSLSTLK